MGDLNDIQTMRDILGRLDAEKPAEENSWGRTKHQGRSGNFLKKIELEVAGNPKKARLLVTGQIGVGKSSELKYFFNQRSGKKSGFWVHCDLEKGAHPERCGATGVFLAILRDSWGSTKSLKDRLRTSNSVLRNKLSTIRDELIERLIDWLKGEKTKDGDILFRFGGMDFPVRLSYPDRDSALALILNKASQHEAVFKRASFEHFTTDYNRSC
jgi:dephospho-CoA kinase